MIQHGNNDAQKLVLKSCMQSVFIIGFRSQIILSVLQVVETGKACLSGAYVDLNDGNSAATTVPPTVNNIAYIPNREFDIEKCLK